MFPKVSRPSARIVCLDAEGRLLLLRWRDPYDGSIKWEPPGGGIEPGETPFQAACRELNEETGFSSELIDAHPIEVQRAFRWNGRDHEHTEWFYLARIGRGELSAQRLRADESEQYLGHRWLTLAEISGLSEPVEPPQLLDIVANLDAPNS